MKKGDTLVCVDDKAMTDEITVGKEYMCLNYSKCIDSVLVMNNHHKKKYYQKGRFKIK